MRRMFTLTTLVFLSLAVATTSCGGGGDELDAVDRELDLAMAEDSLAQLDDAPVQRESVEEPARAESERAPRREAPPPRTTPTPDPEPPPAPRYRQMSVAAGTTLRVSLDGELSTKTSNVGETFTVTVLEPVLGEGGIVIPAGTKIQGAVTALEPSGSAGEQAMIRLDFGQLLLDGESQPVALTVAEANPTTKGRKSTEEKAVTIGAGAVVGGILGRVIGGNATGTIIGGVAGAAAGTAIAMGTGDVDAVLEQGSEMTLRVEEQIVVRRPA